MTVVLVVFLMFAAWALVSASQQWAARRDVQGVAAAAARAGAQGDPVAIRQGGIIDENAAVARAQAIIAQAGYTGRVSVNDRTVTVSVTGRVGYAFPSPGFPSAITATASAVVVSGVSGAEGG